MSWHVLPTYKVGKIICLWREANNVMDFDVVLYYLNDDESLGDKADYKIDTRINELRNYVTGCLNVILWARIETCAL